MASKFWVADSSSGSSEESSDGSQSDTDIQKQSKVASQQAAKRKEWAAIQDSSSSDEDAKRIIKSEKDKRWESLREIITKLHQHQKNQDYAEIDEDFENLVKAISKSQKVIDAEGPPKFLVRALVQLERYVDEKHKDKAGLKKCSKLKASAINRLQKRMPKMLAEFKEPMDRCKDKPESFVSDMEPAGEEESSGDDSSDSESETVKRKRSPVKTSTGNRYSSSSESGSESSSSSALSSSSSSSSSHSGSSGESESEGYSSDNSLSDESSRKVKKSKGKTTKKMAVKSASSSSGSASSDMSDSEMSDSSSSSSSSSPSSEIAPEDMDYETRHARAMIKWGYKAGKEETDEKKAAAKREAVVKRREEAEKRRQMAQQKAKADAAVAADISARRGSTFLPDNGEYMDEKALLTKAKEIVAVRGKRGTERQEQLDNLSLLADISLRKNFYQTYFEILNYLTTLQLDISHMAPGGILPPAMWTKIYQNLFSMLCLVITNPDLTLAVSQDIYQPGGTTGEEETVVLDTEGGDQLPPDATSEASMIALSFVERLDDCLNRAFQLSDPHSKEYRECMTQSVDFCALLWLVWTYYNMQQSAATDRTMSPELSRISARLAQHLYYLPDRLAMPRWKLVAEKIPQQVMACFPREFVVPPSTEPSKLVQKLCTHGSTIASLNDKPSATVASSRIKFRMAMYSIYSMALHDHFYEARDALQAGNYYDQALSLNIPEQALYNRCLSQVGLAAFRLGLVPMTATILSEICGSSKHRELLAQGVAIVKGFEKTAEQEKAERRRLLPAHLHINLDVLEGAYNICSMLVEVLQMCSQQNPTDNEAKYRTSRYKRALELFEKSSTPPESCRESVLATAKQLMRGNWRAAEELIMSMKFWDYIIPTETAVKVQEILKLKMREVALQAYIHNYSAFYDAISMTQLAHMFELPRESVYALISEMIIKKEVSGYLDADSETVLVRQVTPSPLQMAALKLTDHIGSLLDQNEIIHSMKFMSSANDRQKKSFGTSSIRGGGGRSLMSQTTTAASSSSSTDCTKPNFDWVLSCILEGKTTATNDEILDGEKQYRDADQHDTPKDGVNICLPLPDVEASPRVDVTGLCRNTFVHLETASPLARMSQTQLLQSFRNFSLRLNLPQFEGAEDNTDVPNNQIVSVADDDNKSEQAAKSPLADLSKSEFDAVWKQHDDEEEKDEDSMNHQGTTKDNDHPDQHLQTTSDQQHRNHNVFISVPSHHADIAEQNPAVYYSHTVDLDGTPTPRAYMDNFFGTLNIRNDKNPVIDAIEPIFRLISNTSEAGEQLPAKHDPSKLTNESPNTQVFTPCKLQSDTQTVLHHQPSVFDLQDWISNLNEIEEEPILRFDSVDEKPQVVQNELNTDNTSILRRNLCDFISQYQIQKQHFFETNSPETESPFTNIYACTIAQTLLQPPAEKASAENSSKLDINTKADFNKEAGVATGGLNGHPTSCKPCAFYWSKGCMNGDKCQFCHLWHVPKKKKPMKEQKNLMIIARDDGKIAFLRCAIEDALRN